MGLGGSGEGARADCKKGLALRLTVGDGDGNGDGDGDGDGDELDDDFQPRMQAAEVRTEQSGITRLPVFTRERVVSWARQQQTEQRRNAHETAM